MLWVTYANESAARKVCNLRSLVVNLPLSEPSTTPPKSPTSTKKFISKPNDFTIRLKQASQSLQENIAVHTETTFRCNPIFQIRVNKRMLRGFEGFHGELTRLWEDTTTKTQKNKMKHMVADKMENDRRQKVQAKRENKASREVKPKQFGLEAVANRLEGVHQAMLSLRHGIGSEESREAVDESSKPVAIDVLSRREGDSQPAEQQVAADTISATAELDAPAADPERKIDA
jgi:hypothetical protein